MICLIVAVALIVPLGATSTPEEVKGPIVDTVYLDVKLQQDLGLMDAVEGYTDIFWEGLDAAMIQGLDKASQDKLGIYAVPSGSWALLINPIPNEAPYIVNVHGEEFFNPFAIREVRFAINHLINRKYIVDEIQKGSGGPKLMMADPGNPRAIPYGEVATKLGITDEGNEAKALADIENALVKAASLPELEGRLDKKGNWWTFDEKPVTIKFLIRVDDPEGRMKLGDYVSKQIEKTGIKVDKLLWERARCSSAIYGGDPAEYEWNMYTEGWGSGGYRAFFAQDVCQMYAPFFANMPGWSESDFWNYENAEIDEFAGVPYFGKTATAEEFYEKSLKGLELGLKDAVRIYVSYQMDHYAVNKDRFNTRMVYNKGTGLDRYSLITADTKDGVLHVTQYSSRGELFMSACDPIGTHGFHDMYSGRIWRAICDRSHLESPVTGLPMNLRNKIDYDKDLEISYHVDENGNIVGDIPVPPSALKYDPIKEEWVEVGEGTTAVSKTDITILYSNWHDGHPMTIADAIEHDAFATEWATKDAEGDRYYDDPLSALILPLLELDKGMVLNPDGTVTSYNDYLHPASRRNTAETYWVDATNYNRGIPWQLREALAELVANGSASGKVYSFTFGAATDIDLLSTPCVADIKAKLIELGDAEYIPPSIKDYITVEEAVEGYDSIIRWIDEKGHAMISCGPFYLDEYDPRGPVVVLKAFRDPTYPFTTDYWVKTLSYTLPRVDEIDVPLMVSRSEGMTVDASVSAVSFPQGIAQPAEMAEVEVSIMTPERELTYPAELIEKGLFRAVIPSEDLETLDQGSYVISVLAKMKDLEGAGSTTVLLL